MGFSLFAQSSNNRAKRKKYDHSFSFCLMASIWTVHISDDLYALSEHCAFRMELKERLPSTFSSLLCVSSPVFLSFRSLPFHYPLSWSLRVQCNLIDVCTHACIVLTNCFGAHHFSSSHLSVSQDQLWH